MDQDRNKQQGQQDWNQKQGQQGQQQGQQQHGQQGQQPGQTGQKGPQSEHDREQDKTRKQA